MKVYEAARQMEMKGHELLNILKELGYEYRSVNNNINDDVEDLRDAVDKYHADQREEKEKLARLSKGVFLGIVFDPQEKTFKRVMLKMDLSKLLLDENCDVFELGEHGTIHGAKLELFKDMQRNTLTNPKDYE